MNFYFYCLPPPSAVIVYLGFGFYCILLSCKYTKIYNIYHLLLEYNINIIKIYNKYTIYTNYVYIS